MLPACLVLGMAGCATETPPPPPPAVEAPAPPPPPPQAITRSAVGAWSFGTAGTCAATIAGSVASLDLAVDSDAVVFTARLRDTPPPRGTVVTMAYSSAAGAWSVGGTRRPRQPLVIRAAMNEEQASRILFLLDGGTLRFTEPAGRVSILRIPNAGAHGRTWFECVRRKLTL